MDITEADRVRATLSRLKVFPLPTAVLLPGAELPLHIFEPRYRQLTQDALDADGVLAIAMFAPGWEADYQGRPPVLPVAGAGVIERFEKLPDGRFNLLLRGVLRVRLGEELSPDKSYREFRAEEIAEPVAPLAPAEPVRQLVLELCQHLPRSVSGPLAKGVAKAKSPGELCDLAAGALVSDAASRQAVLEAVEVKTRTGLVLAELGELLLRMRSGGSGGGGLPV